MGVPVSVLQKQMSSAEFAEWMAFEQLFGPVDLHQRIDILSARSDALLAEVNRNRKKRKRPYTIQDFLPPWWENLKPKRVEMSASAIWNAFAGLFGGPTYPPDRKDQ